MRETSMTETGDDLCRDLRVSPLQISHAVFEREFSRIIKEHPGEWVVYYKDNRLGIRPTEAEAEQLAIDLDIAEDDTYLRMIEEEPPLSFGFSGQRMGRKDSEPSRGRTGDQMQGLQQ